MICKNCGAIIKQNEDYCRKCGSIVLTFNNHENKELRYICVENNLRGKLQSILNSLLRMDKKEHNVKNINTKKSTQINFSEMGKSISKYMNEFLDENANEKKDSKDTMYLIMETINKLNQKR